jgi:hypothetical protein
VCIIRTSYFELIVRTNISAGHLAMRQSLWGTSAVLRTACDASLIFRCIYAAPMSYIAVDVASCYHGELCCCRARQCVSLSYGLPQRDFPTENFIRQAGWPTLCWALLFEAYSMSLNTLLLITALFALKSKYLRNSTFEG